MPVIWTITRAAPTNCVDMYGMSNSVTSAAITSTTPLLR